MKTLLLPTLLSAATLLTGCAGIYYAGDTYGTARKTDIDVAGITYVVSDRSDLGKMFIRNSIGSAFDNGTRANTATDGDKDIVIDMKQAGQKYLAGRGKKDCTLDSGKEIANLQYEFSYKCKS